MIRTRFAPSPTGSLHLGNARIAVLNWLFARHHGGRFVVRIEDTDQARNVTGSEAEILEDLDWLGLAPDEGPGVGGPYGPYRQSERSLIYRDAADRLMDRGAAYRCYCTAEELEAKREQALARGLPPHYDGRCRSLTAADAARLEREGRMPVLRFRVPDHGSVAVEDVVRGTVRVDAAEIGDFVVFRSDGLPTYNFAVVVDDLAMEISHVIRGVGHLSNTPRQLLLYSALDARPPVFAHVPTVLGPDRQKLAKRHGAQALSDYRREGYHPDAVVNYLSLLAWSSSSGDEFLVRDRLINEVSLERVGAADVVFDPAKLRWLSAKHIERMPVPDLVGALLPFVDRDRFPIPDDVLPAAIEAVRTHLATFSEINEHLDPFLPALDAAAIAARDGLREDRTSARVIGRAADALRHLDSWSAGDIATAIRTLGKELGVSGRGLYEPLRIALTGEPHGPPLAAVIFVLGREATLDLLTTALAPPAPGADAAGDRT